MRMWARNSVPCWQSIWESCMTIWDELGLVLGQGSDRLRRDLANYVVRDTLDREVSGRRASTLR